MKSFKFVVLLLVCLFLFSCKTDKRNDDSGGGHKETIVEAKGDATIEVFKNAPLVFNPKKVPDGYNAEDANGIIRLVNGRLILKKVELPKYERNVEITLKVRLVSTGDPYDRSGSIFIIPNSKKGVNAIDIAKGDGAYPSMEGDLSRYPGIIKMQDYEPCVELMRFMTPFGVGYYSNHPSFPPPSHVGKWKEDVKWECDVSHLYPLMEKEFYMGIWIDTWVKEGFAIDVVIEAIESKENKRRESYNIIPLMNTCPYIGQHYPDVFHYFQKGINVANELKEKNIKNARLYYTTTGHGGYGPAGDEFSKKENIIALGTKTLYGWKPWIDSCKAYRKWNPSSAVFQNGVASSDLARSNWCPGSMVEPISIPLSIDDIKTGDNFSFTIKNANKEKQNQLDFWLVSAYIVWN